jgi:hypothetical protein
MTTAETRFERSVADLLADLAPSHPPDDLIPETQRAVDAARRWPRWLAIVKEPPMRHRSHLAVGSPIARVAAIVAATMLVAIAGAGALVVGAQSPSPAPPEDQAVPQTPAAFTGQIICGDEVTADTAAPTWHQTATMSDPRLEGDHYHSRLAKIHLAQGPEGSQASTVSWAAQRIENEGGAWHGTMVTYIAPGEPANTSLGARETYVLTGEGGYEGLTAIYDVEFAPYSPCGVDVWGVIFEGDLPPIEPFIPEQ